MIVIESKRRKRENRLKKYPDAVIHFIFSKPAYNSEILSKFVVLMTILSRTSQLVLI